MHRAARMPHGVALLVLCATGLGVGCGSSDTSVYVQVPQATPPASKSVVARAVSDLLSVDAERSADALRRLLALDEAEREELRQLATHIPSERDPRWLLVLDELHLGPDLSPEERVAFLLWEGARPEPFFVSKARASLTAQARLDPAPLLAALRAGLPGGSTLAIALALADRQDAVPDLLERFVASEDESERRALAEALTRLLGEEPRLRPTAPREERARAAARVLERFTLGTPPKIPTPPAGGTPSDG